MRKLVGGGMPPPYRAVANINYNLALQLMSGDTQRSINYHRVRNALSAATGRKKTAVPKDGGLNVTLNLLNYSRVAKCLMVRHI